MGLLPDWREWRRGDGFTASYLVWFVALLLLSVSLEELDAAGRLSPFLFAPLLLATTLLLLFALRRDIARRRWRRLVSWIVGLVVAIGAVFALARLGLDPTWARLALTRGQYERAVADLPHADGAPRFKTFVWGDTGFAVTASVSRTLVYDESGEVALGAEQRSQAWRERMLATDEGRRVLRQEAGGHAIVKRISGHFYVLTETYP